MKINMNLLLHLLLKVIETLYVIILYFKVVL